VVECQEGGSTGYVTVSASDAATTNNPTSSDFRSTWGMSAAKAIPGSSAIEAVGGVRARTILSKALIVGTGGIGISASGAAATVVNEMRSELPDVPPRRTAGAFDARGFVRLRERAGPPRLFALCSYLIDPRSTADNVFDFGVDRVSCSQRATISQVQTQETGRASIRKHVILTKKLLNARILRD
jgi:hypothetical protein